MSAAGGTRSRRIVALGGGTGLPILLKALVGPDLGEGPQVTALVNVADDGGSSGRLRQSLGILPPGDLRNCLTACATNPTLACLFDFRFREGGELSGHSLGNLVLAALFELEGDSLLGLEAAGRMLGVRAGILPASTEPLFIAAALAGGGRAEGQARVARSTERILRLTLSPAHPTVLPQALEALSEADLVLIGPGSLYSSILPVLLIPSITAALRETGATVIYICNTMSFRAETFGYLAEEHLRAIEEHVGDLVDLVLASDPSSLGKRALARAKELGAVPVALGDERSRAAGGGAKWMLADMAEEDHPTHHSPLKLSRALRRIMGAGAGRSEDVDSAGAAGETAFEALPGGRFLEKGAKA